jgi:hypothetical protein
MKRIEIDVLYRSMSILRLGQPFFSGYLVSEEAVTDHATTHAWAEVYPPGAGWRGFDSTSGDWVGVPISRRRFTGILRRFRRCRGASSDRPRRNPPWK